MKSQPSPAKSPPKSKPAPQRSTARAPHEVRIIGGLWKRTKLAVADKPGLRPTPDRVRETLFNWLGQDLSGWHCIDVFAGTGALGFEADSRGAKQVLLLEQDAALVAQLTAVKTKLDAHAVQVQRSDGVSALRRATPGSVQLVLLDPPFDSGLYDAALAAAAVAVAPDGWIYLEAPVAWKDEALAPLGLALFRYLKAGAVHAHLLKRAA